MADAPESYFSRTYSYAEEIDPTGLLKNIRGAVFPTDYRFSYDSFPEDLGSEYMNHYMLMRFYTGQQRNSLVPYIFSESPYGPKNPYGYTKNNYNVALAMPDGGLGQFPIWSDTHEYAEISMTNVFANQVSAAATRIVKGIAAQTGRAINPAVQVLYKTTNLRTFQFGFLMTPRSPKEAQAVESIIKHIRMYASPEDQGAFYRAPAEAEIEFHWNGKQNPHIIKLKRQVITGVTVQYTPQQIFSTFTDGYPVSTYLELSTREMEIIDRKDVEQGY